MAGSPTNVGAGYGLDIKTGRAAGPGVRTVYLALLTAAPTATTTLATMSELSTAGYARQSAAWGVPTGTPQVTSTTSAQTWGPFSADPPNVTHAALVSSSSGTTGDLIFWWALNAARDAALGDSITAAAAAFTMQES